MKLVLLFVVNSCLEERVAVRTVVDRMRNDIQKDNAVACFFIGKEG